MDAARSPRGDDWLAQGALATAANEGLGWCEMARGLLVHWVQLDPQGRIARYRVLAPTEWNLHAQGGAARLLAGLASAASGRVIQGGASARTFDFAQVRAVAAAYDPCVELHIEAGALHRVPVEPQIPTPTCTAAAPSEAAHA